MGEDAHISSQFILNVGGVTFSMAASSLDVEPESMLAAIFAHVHQLQPGEKDSAGAFLIRRSPAMFGYIHRYLHNPPLTVEDLGDLSLRGLNALLEECAFYQMTHLKRIVTVARDAAKRETEKIETARDAAVNRANRFGGLEVEVDTWVMQRDMGPKGRESESSFVPLRCLMGNIMDGRGHLEYVESSRGGQGQSKRQRKRKRQGRFWFLGLWLLPVSLIAGDHKLWRTHCD